MERRDNSRYRAFTRRTMMFAGGQVALMSLLVGRMYYLQVIESDEYTMLADDNRSNFRLLAPPRGRILDRFGVEVASNRRNFRIILIPEQTNGVAATLDRLGNLVAIDDATRERVLRDAGRKRGFVPIPVIENLTWEAFSRVNVHSPDLPGVHLDEGETRHYPFDKTLTHIVGYVGAVSEEELKAASDPLLEVPDFRIGKSGIEKYYDLSLRGNAGNSRVEVNAYGRVIREINRLDGVPGEDKVLTIDVALQDFVMHRLGENSASAVVLDIHTGDVLALASNPSFDPNPFTTGISTENWQDLVSNKLKPLRNKAVAGQYPPGSTFKMVVSLAALESGAADAAHRVYCPGHVQLGNHRFHCWKRGGHGWLDMETAIEQSCDVYFYDIAKRIGIERLGDMARQFGFGDPLGIDLPGEKGGLVPSKGWKRAVQGTPWQLGETLIAGIGQGYLLTTPLQLAVMTARLANGGFAVTPRLVRETGEVGDGSGAPAPQAPALDISPAALRVALNGMDRVVNGKRGTARSSRIEEEGWEMAGKTGTAQVRRITKAQRLTGIPKAEEVPWEERDHALFVAFAPVDAPRYAVSVVVEHGGSGSQAAAPIARDILMETQRLDPLRNPGRGRFARWLDQKRKAMAGRLIGRRGRDRG